MIAYLVYSNSLDIGWLPLCTCTTEEVARYMVKAYKNMYSYVNDKYTVDYISLPIIEE